MVLVLICSRFTSHTPPHSASNFGSHRDVPVPTSFHMAAISRFWRYCHWQKMKILSNGWKKHFVIEKSQFRGKYFQYLYQHELEVGLLTTPQSIRSFICWGLFIKLFQKKMQRMAHCTYDNATITMQLLGLLQTISKIPRYGLS